MIQNTIELIIKKATSNTSILLANTTFLSINILEGVNNIIILLTMILQSLAALISIIIMIEKKLPEHWKDAIVRRFKKLTNNKNESINKDSEDS